MNKLEIVVSQRYMHPQLTGERVKEIRFTDFKLAEKQFNDWSENDHYGYQFTTIRIVEINEDKLCQRNT